MVIFSFSQNYYILCWYKRNNTIIIFLFCAIFKELFNLFNLFLYLTSLLQNMHTLGRRIEFDALRFGLFLSVSNEFDFSQLFLVRIPYFFWTFFTSFKQTFYGKCLITLSMILHTSWYIQNPVKHLRWSFCENC